MREIREGLYDKLDVSIYAKPEIEWDIMEQIKLGLKAKVDITIYTLRK